jgi:hypothetical protein
MGIILPLVSATVSIPADMVSFVLMENASSESILSLPRVMRVSLAREFPHLYLQFDSQKPTSTLRVNRVAATISTSGAPLISSATAAFALA